jgi:hypothetical protein
MLAKKASAALLMTGATGGTHTVYQQARGEPQSPSFQAIKLF